MSKSFIATLVLLAIVTIGVISGMRTVVVRDAPRTGGEWCLSDMGHIEDAMDKYLSKYGRYPPEISNNPFRVLSGDNPNNLVFLQRWISKTNAAGEWLDWWGTSYKIEMMNQTNYIIRSAGANGRLGDSDDYSFDSSKLEFIKPH